MHFSFFSVCCIVTDCFWQLRVDRKAKKLYQTFLFSNWWWFVRPKSFLESEKLFLFTVHSKVNNWTAAFIYLFILFIFYFQLINLQIIKLFEIKYIVEKPNTLVTNSNPRVTSSNPRVTSSNSRVRRLKARVAWLKARVGRLKARAGGLKARVKKLKAQVEAIKLRPK